MVSQNISQKMQKNQQQNKQAVSQITVYIPSQYTKQSMISKNLLSILSRIQVVQKLHNRVNPIRLVAVSKTKSVEQILQAYNAGQRHFGQNYVDQISQKHSKLPNDIKWHFIGHLQSNKIKKVMVPNLWVVQTLDRESLAQKLEKYLAKEQPNRVLNVLIQVKTSQEDTKNGCPQEDIHKLYEFLTNQCIHLKFNGFMTIGKQGDMTAFEILLKLKKQFIQKYKLEENQITLSMGMSGDFQQAIAYQSTSVRVGSSIFGARNYPPKTKDNHLDKIV